MKRDNFIKNNNILTIVIIVTLGIALILSLSRSISKIYKAQKQISQAEEKLEKLKKDNEELNKQLNSVEQDAFIEKQLRDKLGLAKEGEIVIVMPSPEIVRKFAPVYISEESKLPEANWIRWIKLFMDK
jgi:cell division protein FtsB